jgi:hypothetical protein
MAEVFVPPGLRFSQSGKQPMMLRFWHRAVATAILLFGAIGAARAPALRAKLATFGKRPDTSQSTVLRSN